MCMIMQQNAQSLMHRAFTKTQCWHTEQDTLCTEQDAPSTEAQSPPMHVSTQQSCCTWSGPSAFIAAISGTSNFLLKVLFTIPSWYLFTIGLKPMLSFRWTLSPTLRFSSKKHDSSKHTLHERLHAQCRSFTFIAAFSKRPTHALSLVMQFYVAVQDQWPRLSMWAIPCSFAIT